LAQAWGNPSPFQDKINELLDRAGRRQAGTDRHQEDTMQGFIVCRDRHPFSASRIHDTLQQAQVEAERLCRKEQDTFLVFVFCGEVRLTQAPIVWTWAAGKEEL